MSGRPRSWLRRWRWLPRGIVVACLTYGISAIGGLDFLDRLLTDARMELGARKATGKVVIVGIDAESLRHFDQWPWPRRYHAMLIDRLLEAGAARIGVDIDFSSRSIPEDDRLLAAALERGGPARIALPVFRQHQPAADGSTTIFETAPLPGFRPYVTEAMANVIPDPDGLIRWLEPGRGSDRILLPTFAGWLAGEGSDGRSSPRNLVDFGIEIATVPYFSYHDILSGRFPPDALQGRLVLVGAVDVSLGDHVTVPRYRALPGVAFHALAAESLLQGRLVHSPDGRWIDVAAAGGTFLFWWLLSVLTPRRQVAAGILVIVVVGLGTLIAQTWWGVAVATAAVLAGLAVAALLKLIEHFCELAELRRDAAQMAAQRHALFVRVVESSLDGIVVFDQHAAILSCNGVAAKFFDRRPDTIRGGRLCDILPEDEERLLKALDAGSSFSAERHFVIENGIRVATQMILNPLDGQGFGKLGIVTLQDVSARKTQTDALIHMATHDALTGLANRTKFLDRLGDTCEQSRRTQAGFAMLLIDLDRFKEVNDSLGHSIGDRLLQDLALRLTRLLGRGQLSARLGGDEFAVLVNGPESEAQSLAQAQDLLDAIRRPFAIAEQSIEVDASIGIARFPEHAQDAEMLIQCADIAMYQAKRSRSGFAVYDAIADIRSKRRLALMADIRQAIADRQLHLCYQPKVNLRDASLAGVEALLRWHHPQFGEISPTEFVPMAEESGCIDDVTLMMVEMALVRYQAWREFGHVIPIAVNLSSRSLQNPAFVDDLLEIAGRSFDDRHAIGFELTESVSVHDDPETIASLQRLHEHGFEIALDDFGTGYSSFAYLRELPIDTLKVDRAFLQVSGNDRNADDVLRGIIDLGHKLGLRTIAEGVETREMGTWLRDLGCDMAQGYYFGSPMPPDAIPDWPRDTPYFADHGGAVTMVRQTGSPVSQEAYVTPC